MSERTERDDDTQAEAALRSEVRAFMEENAAPYGPATRHLKLDDTPAFAERGRAWQRTLAEGGWSVPTWPAELGGRGLSSNEARIVREEETRFAVPAGLFQVASLMVGPTLMACGTPEQQRRFLPAIRQGDHLWCQLFSEPDAGSDLASLRTKAVRDGDEWVVTGPEGVDERGRHRRLGHPAGPHRPRVAAPPGHHVLPVRHAVAGGRGAPDRADQPCRALQRGPPRRGAHPGRLRRGRGRRGLVGGPGHARRRAGDDRLDERRRPRRRPHRRRPGRRGAPATRCCARTWPTCTSTAPSCATSATGC